jgi:hypothetical protein
MVMVAQQGLPGGGGVPWRAVAVTAAANSRAARHRHQIGGVTEIRPVSPPAHITHGGRER